MFVWEPAQPAKLKERSKRPRSETEKQLEDENSGSLLRLQTVSILVWSLKAISLILFPELTQMELESLPDLRSKEGRGEEKRGRRRKEVGKEAILWLRLLSQLPPIYLSCSSKGSDVFPLSQEGWGSGQPHPANPWKNKGSNTNPFASSSYSSMLHSKELGATWGHPVLIQEQVPTPESPES